MKKRLRFGLDLDGVVYDFHSAYRFLANHEFNLNLPPVDELFEYWNKPTLGGYINDEQSEWIWSEGIKRGLFRHGHVRKGAVEFTQALDQLADVVVVTHRPREARQDTFDWLSFHRLPVKEVHLLENGEPKYTVGLDGLLDDKYENVFEFARWGGTQDSRGVGLIWDRVWNRNYSPESWRAIYRMKSWQEVLEWTKKSVSV